MYFDQEKTQGVPIDPEPLHRELREFQLKQAAYADAGQTTGQIGRCLTSAETLAELFKYHPPTPETLPKCAAINQAAKNFAEVVLQNCPGGKDRSRAIEQIQDARMVANRAVALNGLSL
jgi:hypothetical protein